MPATPSRRTRTLGLILALVAAGFALTALTMGISFALTGQTLMWTAVLVYALMSALTLAVTAIAGWVILGEAPIERSGDPVEGSFDAQRRLLDDVRHELKTPITIVRGHLEVMDPTDVEDVTAIRDLGIAELDRMARLIGDIDLLAAVETDRLTMSDVDLTVLTQQISELVSVIPAHEWRTEQRAEGVIRGDRDRLLQAWLQLADNAAKYTPPGSPIELGSALHGSGAQLWVRDHGAGIPHAVRHRIFGRFDRGAGKRTVGGSGLGLAIVDAIAKSHGGHCSVADTPGGGATFTIEIPIGTRASLPSPVRAGDVVLQREASG
ncbi:ATP-binding protein [Microbacterium sp.]|uniref:sensor histidine kinase n=1 Tax=Microbacterium sp. TaxID=51671 RepID=UPI00260150C8|nr:ATP-binding protein [Microbacterium sp.]